MDTEIFLAANTGNGFVSLYDEYPPEGTFLHIIKGGPGTGKSGFMRRLRSAAEQRGLDSVSVLCSGDPGSLDGLYIPTLGQAWVDGTAPHICEPKVFGADSDYVNLGAFCRTPMNGADADEARRLSREYKGKYASAYEFLAAARRAESAYFEPDCADGEKVSGLSDAVMRAASGQGRVRRCFLSAISCRGMFCLHDTVSVLCKQTHTCPAYRIDELLRELKDGKVDIIQCLSPLSPDRTEAVLLPELEIGFISPELGRKLSKGEKHFRGEGNRIKEKLLSRAVEELAQAKELHDKLEKVYRPYMDFAALTAYTEETILGLFR